MTDNNFKYLVFGELIIIILIVIIKIVLYLVHKHDINTTVNKILNNINHKKLTNDKYDECIEIINKFKEEDQDGDRN